jgi:superfamily II DNA or RNA helicase
LIYLQGGTSEIKVRQAIGRGTRIVPGLTDFWVVDFNVVGSDAMERHFQTRLEYYQDMTSEEIKVNG